jgi:protein gp37
MAANTSIEWTDATWPVIAGCKEISPGCANCYSARLTATRLRHTPKYRGLAVIGANGHPRFTGESRLAREHLHWPMKWRAPRRIFVADMSDLFYERVTDGEIMDVFRVISGCPLHTFQILTKRPERMAEWFRKWADVAEPGAEWDAKLVRGPAEVRAAHSSARSRLFADMIEGWGTPPDGAAYPSYDWMEGPRWWPAIFHNAWLGVSVEDRKHGLPRIDALRRIPAAVRFLSIEPLLEDLGTIDLSGIHQVIVGGESGPGARPMHPDWARSIRDQCVAARVSFFFKQWGHHAPWLDESRFTHSGAEEREHVWLAPNGDHGACWIIDDDGSWSNWTGEPPMGPDGITTTAAVLAPIGKKRAGRILDGRTWDEFPTVRS